MPTEITGLDGLKNSKGKHLGFSPWHLVDQKQIDLFAQATGDNQWIHVDQAAASKGPFGATIAHGYLTLSLVAVLLPEVLWVSGVGMALNYGTNKVRFPSPVLVNSKLRLGAVIRDIEEVTGATQLCIEATIEIQGMAKPALAAELLFRYYT